MNALEEALVAALRVKENVLEALDSIRPKIVFKRSLKEYRSMVFGEVYVEDLAKALGAKGPLRLVY